ncbi:MAG: beta-methylgalactoside transporter inner rane component [Nocardioides sp.]|uniref:ABC transporter permease n=1 Tax=Nocardioides sp. TaxID=35761 RepID=UPI002637A4CC|nr:ABC transporter permease [Nocardioides sp.]MCW2835497.1 beta-methylgalactoside transporter inner rane component [Nocardioides sp.]
MSGTETPPPAPHAQKPTPEGEEASGARPQGPSRSQSVLREIASGNALAGVLAVFLAVLVGSVMIALTDEEVRASAGYVFARPGDFLQATWDAIWGAYTALFRGAVYNDRVDDFATQIRPLTETLKFAGPLIAAGLGVGLAFRASLFNIGGRGQMLLAGAAAGWVSFTFDLPMIVHLPLAILAAMLAGALWAGLAGLLKARTGAHEVIVTIMLNYVGYYLVFYALSRQGLLQAPGSSNPKSAPAKESAILPDVLGERFNLHLGFVLALVAVAGVWWLLNRSTLGYRIRAVGENPTAARASGIDVGRTYVVVMLIAGALVGLAGANQVLGTVTSGVTTDLDAGIGFDAITVALLGRSRPLGILGAGLLFGAFKAGGFSMQASEGIPVDIVLVVQSLIVLFIAAPPLVRAIFRLPAKEAK